MRVIAFVGAAGVGAELTGDDRAAELTLLPHGGLICYQLDEHFAEQLFRDVTAHFAEQRAILRVIRYQEELAPITVADLAAFAVPILPAT